jgi:hypothetical protein
METKTNYIKLLSTGTILLIVSLIGCNSELSMPNKPNKGYGGGIFAPQRSRFTINMQAKGAFKPNKPISLPISVRINVPTDSAKIRIFSPYLYYLRHCTPGQQVKIPMNTSIPPWKSWTPQHMDKGYVFNKQPTLTIKIPGYYEVALSVKGKGKEPAENSAHKTLWLFITKNGGKVTKKLDHSLFPKDIRPQAGPFRKKTKSSYTTCPEKS